MLASKSGRQSLQGHVYKKERVLVLTEGICSCKKLKHLVMVLGKFHLEDTTDSYGIQQVCYFV